MERASRYCFNEGGALADVMSLYENTNENGFGDQQEEGTEVREQGNSHMAIEVYYVFFVYVHTILNFRSLSGYAFLLRCYSMLICYMPNNSEFLGSYFIVVHGALSSCSGNPENMHFSYHFCFIELVFVICVRLVCFHCACSFSIFISC